MKSAFQPIHAILCDDIRQEDNGKGMLIGVISGDLLLKSPWKVKAAFWIEGRMSDVGEPFVEFKTELLDSNGNVYLTGLTRNIEIKYDGEQSGIVMLHSLLDIEKSGELTLSLKSEGQWKEFFRKKILILPNELEQPSPQ